MTNLNDLKIKDFKLFDSIQLDISELSKKDQKECIKMIKKLSKLGLELNIKTYKAVMKLSSKKKEAESKMLLDFDFNEDNLMYLIVLYFKFFGSISINFVKKVGIPQIPFELFDLSEERIKIIEDFNNESLEINNISEIKVTFDNIIKEKKNLILKGDDESYEESID